MSLSDGLILYLILLSSLSVHEWAHAWTASKLGDPTARSMGRVTLNPIAHIDLIGTVIIPLFMILFSPGFFLIGWGKPVPVDPRYFKNRTRDDIFVSMAGPLSNLVICVLTVVVGGLLLNLFTTQALYQVLSMVIMLNCVLIIFNLLPIPPLDGSHVMRHVVGMRDETYYRLSQYGFITLIVLINIPGFRQIFGGAIQSAMGFFMIFLHAIAGLGNG
jgi:Zn-dependent protease